LERKKKIDVLKKKDLEKKILSLFVTLSHFKKRNPKNLS